MTTLTDIVSVQISRETQTVDRASFGIPLFVVDHGDTAATITERVTAYSGIAGVADDYAATDVAYKMAAAAFSQEIRPERVKICLKGTDETYVEALTAAVAADNDWYAIACETVLKADIEAIAAYVETLDKIYIARTADADVKTSATDDVASVLNAAEYDRTAVIYDSLAVTQYADAAWIGACIVNDPGSQTWAYWSLNGITYNSLTAAEADYAHAKKVTTYERVAGVNVTVGATVASGEYIDVMRGVDWLKARMQERIYGKIINAKKIPYTNAGIAIIETQVREQLDIAIEQGLIAPEPAYTVTVPDVLDTDEADRQARTLKNVNFRARLAGALHKVEIVGAVYA